jgi:pimeloyl-ACP methyl ester carboxylesterase
MTTFVLIHGGFHGAWCWYKVIPLLERIGHRVIAPDLASLGSDKTPISKVAPNTWADSIIQILDAETDPVVLVGHSRGGLIISQAAEARPEKSKTLVYLSGVLLQNGQFASESLELDPESLIGPNLIINNEEGYATIRKTAIRQVFYADCREEDVVLARLMLQPEAMAPLTVPLHITPENFGRIPRVYIEKVLGVRFQVLQRFSNE